MTTCERDRVLSHFAVHVSPIYYLFLPFYALFPSPVTLEVLQALLLASAVIPLWRIARRHGLSGVTAGLLCALLLLWPAYAGGTSYDVHENKFLTPLLLWLFDFLDRRCVWGVALFSVLTCMVKEDAPVYVAVIALWVILRALTRHRGGAALGPAHGRCDARRRSGLLPRRDGLARRRRRRRYVLSLQQFPL